jgi:hypothetical protein
MLRTLLLASTMAFSAQAHAVCGPFSDVMLYALDGSNPDPADSVTGAVADGQNLTAVAGCVAGTMCRSFNGVNSALVIPYAASRSDLPANKCLRVSAHIKPSGPIPASGDDIIRNADYPANRWKLEISDPDAQQRIRCEVKGSAGGTMVAIGGPSLYDGRWHEVVCRVMRAPDRLEAWVSTCATSACVETPILVATTYGAIGAIISGNNLTVGRHPPPDAAGFYTGLLDNVKIRTATNQ